MHRYMFVALATLLVSLGWTETASSAQSSIEARTTHGVVIGVEEPNNILSFKGIPYGADTAAKRFQRPHPPKDWDTPRDATRYGPSCPQRGASDISENCLFLNVWTPSLKPSETKRPVIVYLHGGAYSHGSGSDPLYDGTKLVEKGDVVVLTVNHRLGVFGYGYFNQMGAPDLWQFSGNVGQLDIILALKWVQANIANFGGNPENVTLVGQSGGGGKIATLMAMPDAKGLFHKAMTMSGQQVTASGPLNATKRSEAFLSKLGIKPHDLEELGSIPMDDLLKATTAEDPVLGYGRLYYGPVLDMRSLFRHPFYPNAAEQSAHIPMIIGNTQDETRLFLSKKPEHFTMTWEELPKLLAPQMRVDIDPYHVTTEYRRLFPNLSPSEIFFKATTAARSWRAAIIEAEERAKQGTQTWVYQLNWQSPKDGGKWRAPHTLDIPLIFMNTDVKGAISGNSKGAQQMANIMSDIVLTFARNGSPNAPSLPNWPVFNLDTRPTLILDLPPKIENDPRGAERQLFATVPYIQPGS